MRSAFGVDRWEGGRAAAGRKHLTVLRRQTLRKISRCRYDASDVHGGVLRVLDFRMGKINK